MRNYGVAEVQEDPVVTKIRKELGDSMMSFAGELASKMTPEMKSDGNYNSIYSSLKNRSTKIQNPDDPAYYSMPYVERLEWAINQANDLLDENPIIAEYAPKTYKIFVTHIVNHRNLIKGKLAEFKNNEALEQSWGGRKQVKKLLGFNGAYSLKSERTARLIILGVTGSVILTGLTIALLGAQAER